VTSVLTLTRLQILFHTHIFPDELRDGAGKHEAGHSTGHDVKEGVHDPRTGGGFDRRAEGTAERAGSRSTAAAYLWRTGGRNLSIQTKTTHSLTKHRMRKSHFHFHKSVPVMQVNVDEIREIKLKPLSSVIQGRTG